MDYRKMGHFEINEVKVFEIVCFPVCLNTVLLHLYRLVCIILDSLHRTYINFRLQSSGTS